MNKKRILFAIISIALFSLASHSQTDVQQLQQGRRPESVTTYIEKRTEAPSILQNRLIWRTDTGPYLDQYICYGSASDPIKFDILIDRDTKDLKNVKLTLSVWDVDEGEGEVDQVYVNDNYVGILHGANDSWSVNNYTVNAAYLKGGTTQAPGRNEIMVDLTVSGWCVTVDWGALSADANVFSVTSYTPKNGQLQVDFAKPEIQATFSEDVDGSTINTTTFQVAYFDQTAAMVPINGTLATSGKTVTFNPAGSLMDGVKYVVQLKSGTSGIKSKGGALLEKDVKWSFTTTPNVVIEKIVPVQTAEGSNMIALKRGMIRVYATWDRKTNVHSRAQADRITAKVSVESNGIAAGTQTVTIKRRDAVTAAEKRTGRQSVNFFNWFPPVGGNSLKAKVELTHHNGNVVVIERTSGYTTQSKFVDLKYQYVALQVGTWAASGVTIPWAGIGQNVQQASQVMNQQFPIMSVASSSGGTFNPGLPKPWRYALITELNYVAMRLFEQWQRTLQPSGTQFIVGYVPSGYLGAGVTGGEGFSQWLVNWGGNSVNILTEDANGSILPHEIGHAWTLGHSGSSPSIEGYEVDLSGTRGRQRSISSGNFVTSLMDETPGSPDAAFITNADYNTLLSTARKSTVEILPRSLTTPVFLIAGFIDPTDNVVLDPIRKQDFTNTAPPTSGIYTVEQVSATNAVIATNNFDPASPIVGTDGRQYRMFSIGVPFNATTQRIRIKRGATILHEVVRTANNPVVTISSPSANAIWSGTRTVSWTATDADGDAMTYDVSYSPDNGATWHVLALETSSNSLTLNTDLIPQGSNCRLSVSASDGFNTTVATVNFTVANGLSVVGTIPASSANNVPITPSLQAQFGASLHSSSITSTVFTLTTGTTTVGGTVGYDPLNKILRFTPIKSGFTPSAELQYATTYTARIRAGIKDTSGNVLASDYVWTFVTQSDDSPLEIDCVWPEAAEVGVAVNAPISILFSKSVNAATVNTTNIRLTVQPLGQLVTATVAYHAASRTATLKPSVSLAANTRYQCNVTTAVQSTDAKPLSAAYDWFFVTGSDSLKVVNFTGKYVDRGIDNNNNGLFDSLAVDVEVAVTVAGRFSMNGRLADKNGNELLWGAVQNVSLPVGTSVLTLRFNGSLINAYSTDGPYQLTDLMIYNTSNTNINDWVSFATTTAAYRYTQFEQSSIPAAVDLFPPDGARGVPTNVVISVRFTRAMNPATIDSTTFVLRDFGNLPVPAVVRFDTATRVATLKPTQTLQPDTLYTVSISRSICGKDGTQLIKQYNWGFTTGSGKLEGTVSEVMSYPNPFPHKSLPSGGMYFTYVLAGAGKVKIRVYTVAGDFLKEIPDDIAPARQGYNEVAWDGCNSGGELIASGTYLYVVHFNDSDGAEHRVIKKFTVVR